MTYETERQRAGQTASETHPDDSPGQDVLRIRQGQAGYQDVVEGDGEMKDKRNIKKRGVKCTVRRVPHEITVTEYVCPKCKMEVRDFSLSRSILRIRCSQCGQELILT